MNISDALTIGGLTYGKIVAGESGKHRGVQTIEVMEVPEVAGWATAGVLVLTSFYSSKDDPAKQLEIIQGLIDREAAGIVIKLGRYVTSIREELKALANASDFPIITIPTCVAYNDILTPINKRLFEEKRVIENPSTNLIESIDFMDFSTFTDSLELLSKELSSPLYVEDVDGRLLYRSTSFVGDTWRNKLHLFSKPTYSSYQTLLSQWKEILVDAPYVFVDLPGHRDRLLLPLMWKNELYAMLHMIDTDVINHTDTLAPTIKKMNDHMSSLFMINQINQQKKRINDMEWSQKMNTEEMIRPFNQSSAMIHFDDDWLQSPTDGSVLIDYESIIHHELRTFIHEGETENTVLFNRDGYFYGVIWKDKDAFSQLAPDLEQKLEYYNRENEVELKIALSTSIPTFKGLEELLNIVGKTMEIGKRVMPEEHFYLYDKMGIYVILLELTSDDFTKVYTDNLLLPLKEEPELLETIRVYIEVNGNITKASEQLFIHRRTMDYRVNNISELLNMDVKDARNRFILQFCLMIQQLQQ